ncbi:MAG: NAD-dependent epimerase/dehydratase family protein [Patescibacteria group bacterium]
MVSGNRKVLVTGGTGFIGSNLVKELAKINQVVVVGRNNWQGQLPKKTRFIRADVRSSKFLKFLKNSHFDYIFHFAGNADPYCSVQKPIIDFKTNAVSTLKILEILRGLKSRPRFVFASSVAVYGNCRDKKLSEDISVPLPISPYGVSKLTGERYVSVYARQYGIPALSLRLFSTYGPGHKRQIIFDFIEKLSKNPEDLEIIGDGKQARDLVFIDDQIKNIIRVAERGNYDGSVYNLGSGKLYSTLEIAKTVGSAMGLRPQISFTGRLRSSDGQVWRADIKKIVKLGCRITTPLNSGIIKTVAWQKRFRA